MWIDVTWGAGGSTADTTLSLCETAMDVTGRTKGSSAKSCVLYTDAALKDMVTTEIDGSFYT